MDGPEVAHNEPGGTGGPPGGEDGVGEEAAAAVELAEVDGRDDGHWEELQMVEEADGLAPNNPMKEMKEPTTVSAVAKVVEEDR
jgi:hypothetical protein